MTQQAHDTLMLCGSQFHIPSFANFPKKHPLIEDGEAPVAGKRRVPQPVNSACWRGYVAEWKIGDDGILWLTSVSGRYRLKEQTLRADWVSGTLPIHIGEIDETRLRTEKYPLVRRKILELHLKKGCVNQWRITRYAEEKPAPWTPGFNWPEILAAFQQAGIGPDFQPPRAKPKKRLNDDDHAEIAAESAQLLHHARHEDRHGEKNVGATTIAPEAWNLLSQGWADPLPDLTVHNAISTLRGHGPAKKSTS